MSNSSSATRASLLLRLPDAADVVAWDQFVSIYGAVIQRVAVHRGLQPADAENLTQEVFLSVAKSIGNWLEREDRGSFRAWLLKISHNHAVNLLTRRATRPLANGSETQFEHLSGIPDRDADLSAQIDLEYQREVFQWAACQVREVVSETTWKAFWLTQVENVPIEEAARQLKIGVGNIYFARSRVMRRLRDLVKTFEAKP